LVQGASPVGLVDRLQQAGAAVVAIEPDGAIIAFRDDANLSDFREGVEQYIRGPRTDPATGQPRLSTVWDVLEAIDADRMRLWGRGDRVGRRLSSEIGTAGELIDLQRLYVVDVELWHRGSSVLTQASVGEVRRLVQTTAAPDERVRDEFVGDTLCLMKVSVRGAKLGQLLELDAVAEVELPPVAVFDVTMANRTTSRQFPTPPRPPEDGARVCVIDSGIAPQHPLLASNVGSYESVLTANASGIDECGHGTMVAGIAVFGDVRRGYEQGRFESEVTVFSARVLNERNEFDEEQLIIRQMERAIETFKAEPYRCRVFNLSLGSHGPWFRNNRRQSLWAECLDQLARRHKVLLVVSAGNHAMGTGQRTRQAEEAVVEYPNYFFSDDECGLCEPATAAIAVTVGGVAQYDVPAVRRGSNQDNITRPIAIAGQPSPMTRIGPGIGSAIKPEFVAPAGNGLFDGFSSSRSIRDDGGLAVMSFARDWVAGGLFSFDVGTSFAAPRVARIAALVWQRLRETLGDEIDPNTVRAVLATAAAPPQATVDLVGPLCGEDGVLRVCGYGEIDEDFALNTGDRRVTFVTQGQIQIDTIQIFALPIPDEFRETAGRKRVTVGLAFDPPVRSRRAEYLGVDMSVALVRGMSVEEIVAAYRAISRQERDAAEEAGTELPSTPQDARRCKLKPGPRALAGSTLHRSEWTFQRSDAEYGDTYYLVVRAERNWAPDSVTHQDFGLAVSLSTEAEIQLYSRIRQRVQPRLRT
jgi:hypothetical protein